MYARNNGTHEALASITTALLSFTNLPVSGARFLYVTTETKFDILITYYIIYIEHLTITVFHFKISHVFIHTYGFILKISMKLNVIKGKIKSINTGIQLVNRKK